VSCLWIFIFLKV
jgi:hypothetical protein